MCAPSYFVSMSLVGERVNHHSLYRSFIDGVCQAVSHTGSHILFAFWRFLMNIWLCHIFFRFPSCCFFSFHLVSSRLISRKVAMVLKLNNFWYVGQMSIMLYIFGILRVLSVQHYQKKLKILWCVTSRSQTLGVGAHASKIVKIHPFLTHLR